MKAVLINQFREEYTLMDADTGKKVRVSSDKLDKLISEGVSIINVKNRSGNNKEFILIWVDEDEALICNIAGELFKCSIDVVFALQNNIQNMMKCVVENATCRYIDFELTIDYEYTHVETKWEHNAKAEMLGINWNGGEYEITIDVTQNGTAIIPSGIDALGSVTLKDRSKQLKKLIISDVYVICSNICEGEVRDKVSDVVIKKGCRIIDKSAFATCMSLKRVEIPEGVVHIGAAAFRYCYLLESINIPKSVRYIGNGAFLECSSLKDAVIPNRVKFIGNSTFKGCSSLVSIDIPESVKYIDGWAFCDCKSLINISIPEGVEYIGEYAFHECKSLKQVTLPNRVKCIEQYTFSGCTTLEDINIPNGVTLICEEAFYDCESLTSVDIPESVKRIGYGAFYGCKKLESVNIHRGTQIEYNTFPVNTRINWIG